MNLNEIKRDVDWVAFAVEHKAQTMDLVARAGDAADMAMKTALSGLPRFRQEGNFTAEICYVGAEPAPWGDGSEIVLCMYLWDGDIQQGDWWRGSLATSYATGNNAGKTRLQLTIDALKKIGFDAEQTGSLDGALALVGQEIPIWVKSSVKGDKTYYNIGAIGSSFEVKPSINLRSFRIGQPGNAPAAPQWQQPAAPAPNPFQQSAPQNPAAQKFGGQPAAPAAPAASAAPPSPFGPWNGGNGNGNGLA